MPDIDEDGSQTQEEPELEQGANEEPEKQEEEVVEPEGVEPEEPETTEPEAEPEKEPEEEELPSLRENKRITSLLKKLQEASQPTEPTKPQERQIIGEGEYTVDELNKRAEDYGAARYREGLSQANALGFSTRLEIDVPRVSQKYPILDPNSDSFDPGVSAFINESYLRTVGYNPQTGAVQNNNIRYEEYTDAQMELVEALTAARNVDSAKNLAKQAAQTGVRPSGVAKKPYQGDNPKDMTTEQLDAVINSAFGIK